MRKVEQAQGEAVALRTALARGVAALLERLERSEQLVDRQVQRRGQLGRSQALWALGQQLQHVETATQGRRHVARQLVGALAHDGGCSRLCFTGQPVACLVK